MVDIVDTTSPTWLNVLPSPTGVQYNARKLDKQTNQSNSYRNRPKGLLTLDWLTVNFTGDLTFGEKAFGEEFEKGDFLFRFLGGTENFQSRAIVFYKRKIFGTMVWSPRDASWNPDLIQFRFENYLFYEGSLIRNYYKIDRLIALLGINYEGISRIDVAYDFNAFDHCEVQELLRLYHDDVIRSRGRKTTPEKENTEHLLKGSTQNDTFYKAFSEGRKIINALYLGSPNSAKCLKLYNKSLKLQKENKPYIVDCWKKLGLELQEVYRLEVTFKSDYFKKRKKDQATGKYVVIDESPKLRDVFRVGYLAGLFSKGCKYVFEFYYTDTLKSRTDRATTYKALDFKRLCTVYHGFSIVADTQIKSKKKSKQGIFNTCRSLFVRYVNNRQDFTALRACLDHAAHNLIYDAVNEKFERWLDQAWKEAIDYSPFDAELFKNHQEEYKSLFYYSSYNQVYKESKDRQPEKQAPVYVIGRLATNKAPF